MTVKERLKIYAKSQEKSVRAFEVACGLTVGYINAIRVSIQPDKIQSIASRYPSLNIDWLLTGEGEMTKNELSEEPINTQNIKSMTLETLNRMLSIIEKQQDDIHLANLNVKQSLDNQANLISLIPGGIQPKKAMGGAK